MDFGSAQSVLRPTPSRMTSRRLCEAYLRCVSLAIFTAAAQSQPPPGSTKLSSVLRTSFRSEVGTGNGFVPAAFFASGAGSGYSTGCSRA